MAGTSKGYRRFKDRLDYFRTDNEMVEVLVLNKELLKGDNEIFKKVDATSFPLLFNRSNSSNSRRQVVQHLRRTVFVAFIKEMYEEATEYLRYILREAAMNGANYNRLIGEHNVNMKANDILSKGTKKEIVQMIMDQVFQQIENERSTIDLIPKIKNKLGLSIRQDLIDQALPYLLIRHIFVHADGKPDEAFKKKYPRIVIDVHGRVQLSLGFVTDAYFSISNLLKAIDNEMINKRYISPTEI